MAAVCAPAICWEAVPNQVPRRKKQGRFLSFPRAAAGRSSCPTARSAPSSKTTTPSSSEVGAKGRARHELGSAIVVVSCSPRDDCSADSSTRSPERTYLFVDSIVRELRDGLSPRRKHDCVGCGGPH